MVEELGIQAGNWLDLGTLDPFTTIVVSPTRLFLARDLTFGTAACEGTEQICRRAMPLSTAVEQVMASQITHGPSCALILKTLYWLQGAGKSGDRRSGD